MIQKDDFIQLTTQQKVDLVNSFTDGTKTLTEINKNEFAFTNISKYIPANEARWDKTAKCYKILGKKEEVFSNAQQFTEEEVTILKNLIAQQKLAEEMKIRKEDEVINRSINVYKEQYKQFAAWCKENRVAQHDALYEAIKLLMNKSL